MPRRLEGRIAVIAGAGSDPDASGISNGLATALTFSREGARIFAIDADPRALSWSLERISAEGGRADGAIADVRNRVEVEAALTQCMANVGLPTILHNNVGVGSTGGVVSISDEEWTRVIDTNLVGIRNTCRATLPLMVEAGGGSVINVSSLLAQRALRRIPNVAYSASKAGLEALTRVLAVEFAPKGIRANNLILGLIDTPQVRIAYERRRAIPGNSTEADRIWNERGTFPPLGRQGTPWEAANAALFLASDDSSYVTGIDLRIDGGLNIVYMG